MTMTSHNGPDAAPSPDEHLADQIRAALCRDERLSGQPVEVSVRAGTVRLSGTVQSHRRRLAAVEIAGSFVGATSVEDGLEVEPPVEIPDDEIADQVRTALAAHPDVAKSTISVNAEAGVVTLSGNVRTRGARVRAEDVALGAEGVRSVRNMLLVDVASQLEDQEMGHTIRAELARELGAAAAAIRVTFAEDTAVLSGVVREPWHRAKADEIARSCRVVHLRNEIHVEEGGPA